MEQHQNYHARINQGAGHCTDRQYDQTGAEIGRKEIWPCHILPGELENSAPATHESDQEKDQEQEEQDFRNQGCRGRQNREAEYSAYQCDDQEHECVIKHAAPPDRDRACFIPLPITR